MRLNVGTVLLWLWTGLLVRVLVTAKPRHKGKLPFDEPPSENTDSRWMGTMEDGLCPKECHILDLVMVCNKAGRLSMIQVARCLHAVQATQVVEFRSSKNMCSCSLMDYIRLTSTLRLLTFTPVSCGPFLLDKCGDLMPEGNQLQSESQKSVIGMVVDESDPGWRQAGQKQMKWVWSKVNSLSPPAARTRYRNMVLKAIKGMFWSKNEVKGGRDDHILPSVLYRNGHMGPLFGKEAGGWYPAQAEGPQLAMEELEDKGQGWLPLQAFENFQKEAAEANFSKTVNVLDGVTEEKEPENHPELHQLKVELQNETVEFTEERNETEVVTEVETEKPKLQVLQDFLSNEVKAIVLGLVCVVITGAIICIVAQMFRRGPPFDRMPPSESSAGHASSGHASSVSFKDDIDSKSNVNKEDLQRRMSQPYSKWTSEDFELARQLENKQAQEKSTTPSSLETDTDTQDTAPVAEKNDTPTEQEQGEKTPEEGGEKGKKKKKKKGKGSKTEEGADAGGDTENQKGKEGKKKKKSKEGESNEAEEQGKGKSEGEGKGEGEEGKGKKKKKKKKGGEGADGEKGKKGVGFVEGEGKKGDEDKKGKKKKKGGKDKGGKEGDKKGGKGKKKKKSKTKGKGRQPSPHLNRSQSASSNASTNSGLDQVTPLLSEVDSDSEPLLGGPRKSHYLPIHYRAFRLPSGESKHLPESQSPKYKSKVLYDKLGLIQVDRVVPPKGFAFRHQIRTKHTHPKDSTNAHATLSTHKYVNHAHPEPESTVQETQQASTCNLQHQVTSSGSIQAGREAEKATALPHADELRPGSSNHSQSRDGRFPKVYCGSEEHVAPTFSHTSHVCFGLHHITSSSEEDYRTAHQVHASPRSSTLHSDMFARKVDVPHRRRRSLSPSSKVKFHTSVNSSHSSTARASLRPIRSKTPVPTSKRQSTTAMLVPEASQGSNSSIIVFRALPQGRPRSRMETYLASDERDSSSNSLPLLGGNSSSRNSLPVLGGNSSSRNSLPVLGGNSSSRNSLPVLGGNSSSRNSLPVLGENSSSRNSLPALGGNSSNNKSLPVMGGNSSNNKSPPVLGKNCSNNKSLPVLGGNISNSTILPALGENSNNKSLPVLGGNSSNNTILSALGGNSSNKSLPGLGGNSSNNKSLPGLGGKGSNNSLPLLGRNNSSNRLPALGGNNSNSLPAPWGNSSNSLPVLGGNNSSSNSPPVLGGNNSNSLPVLGGNSNNSLPALEDRAQHIQQSPQLTNDQNNKQVSNWISTTMELECQEARTSMFNAKE